MIADTNVSRPGVERGDHLCWIVDDESDYTGIARSILSGGDRAGEKLFAFGPAGSNVLTSLQPYVAVAADPRVAFLDGGPFDAERMFDVFRDQTERARAEGFTGLRLVADMDWLLPLGLTPESIAAFEGRLDQVVDDLGATVVCAYRQRSFGTDAIVGASCVHPAGLGAPEPPFRFVAGDRGAWRLSGEVDLHAGRAFAGVISAAALGGQECVVDVSGLEFIDVDGVRAIARASLESDGRIVLRGAPTVLRRCWEVAGFDLVAPAVEFVP